MKHYRPIVPQAMSQYCYLPALIILPMAPPPLFFFSQAHAHMMHTHIHTFSLSLSLSLSHTHTHTRTHTNTLTQTHCLSLSHTRAYAHTHTHTHVLVKGTRFTEVPWPIGSSGRHKGRFSRDSLPAFSARGHRQQVRHGQGCPSHKWSWMNCKGRK